MNSDETATHTPLYTIPFFLQNISLTPLIDWISVDREVGEAEHADKQSNAREGAPRPIFGALAFTTHVEFI